MAEDAVEGGAYPNRAVMILQHAGRDGAGPCRVKIPKVLDMSRFINFEQAKTETKPAPRRGEPQQDAPARHQGAARFATSQRGKFPLVPLLRTIGCLWCP